MAIALHRMTGLPIVKIVGLKRNLDPAREKGHDWCEEPAHLAVGFKDLWVDVDGVHRRIPKERLQFSLLRPEKIEISPSSEEEALRLYSLAGVSGREISRAMDDAKRDLVLGPIIRQMASSAPARPHASPRRSRGNG
jgi:hypothetical protein